jgi:hypothetical protein
LSAPRLIEAGAVMLILHVVMPAPSAEIVTVRFVLSSAETKPASSSGGFGFLILSTLRLSSPITAALPTAVADGSDTFTFSS